MSPLFRQVRSYLGSELADQCKDVSGTFAAICPRQCKFHSKTPPHKPVRFIAENAALAPSAVKCHAERSRVKRSFTKAQASRPWIHALSPLSPFVRLLRRLTTAVRPCGTRAALRQRTLPPIPEKTTRHAQRFQQSSATGPFCHVRLFLLRIKKRLLK